MRNATPIGPYWDITLAPAKENPALLTRLGVLKGKFDSLHEIQWGTAIAQYYVVVQDGLLFARTAHLFRGLKRSLMLDDNMEADQDVLVYSWAPLWDAEDWVGPRHDGKPGRCQPPPNRAFVVLARMLKDVDEYGVSAVVLHWNWVEEDQLLKGAPIKWKQRYTEKLWSKHR